MNDGIRESPRELARDRRPADRFQRREGRSIEDQQREAWALAHRLELDIVGEFTEAQTASKPGRPVFAEMLKRIEKGEADAILAWEPNRLARNSIDGGQVLYMLDRKILRHLCFVNYHFTNDSHGMFGLYMAFAQSKYYTDNLSENVRRGLRQRIERGIYPGKAKRGYFNDPKAHEILPDPETFDLVQLMFKEYATDAISLRELGLKMYPLGLTNRIGNALSASQVQLMLTDPFYYGAFLYNGELYNGNHKPAVTKTLWDMVQAKMRSRGKPKTYKKHQKFYAFRGFMSCAGCGRSVTAETQKGHNYYHCTKRTVEGCNQPFLREENLASQLNEVMNQVALPDEWIERMLAEIEKLEKKKESRIKARLAKLNDELNVIQSRLSRLADLYISQELDRADYTARKAVLVNQKVENAEARKYIAKDKGSRMFEPLRRPLKLVLDWKYAPAVDDLSKLRDTVAEVGSNWSLDSRKVLWDWIEPFGLLAKSGLYPDWLGSLDSNQD